MKTIVVLLLAVAFAVAADESVAEKELLKADTEFYNAFVHSDLATMDRMMSEDAVWIWTGGKESKKELLQQIKKRSDSAKDRASKRSRSLSETKVRFFGDMAIVNGVETEAKTTANGESRTDTTNYTSVWTKRNGSWHLLNGQWTLVPAPAAPGR